MTDLIDSFLDSSKKELDIILESGMHSALSHFVEKDDKSAISDFVNRSITYAKKIFRK